ncbi:MAG TPA: ABC transporter permease [Actinomycetota bacterium]|nr:ABC transporter permease [Actinomycetota bacterium]
MKERGRSHRGDWAIVARREFVERGRDRGFVISTIITLVILVVIVVVSSLLDRGTTFDLGVTGDDAREIGRLVVPTARALDIEIDLVTLDGNGAASAAVDAGDVDAAVLDDEILVKGDPPGELVSIVQAISQQLRSVDALASSGLDREEAREALNQPPLPVRALEPVDDRRRENSAVAFVGVLVLYGQIFAYGYWVAAGVMEEKASRVVEVLLATVRPSQLLRGKILGIGLLGLAQLLLIGVAGLTAAQVVGALDFPSGAVATIGLVLAWFVLGFFFYAGLFSVAGAIVTRQEDLQTTMTPLTIVIVGSFFIGISATGNPDSTLATVASLLPPSAPLVMPSRIVLGEAEPWTVLVSVTLSLASIAALVPISTKIYSRAVLRTGKVRLRQVVRAER